MGSNSETPSRLDCPSSFLSCGLVLASASPRRRDLLVAAGIGFETDSAGIDEITEGPSPEHVAVENAVRKAEAVSPRHPGRIVLGSDTVVSLDGLLFGKPSDNDEAEWMLRALSGRVHEVVTGVCLIRDTDRRVFHETTRVRFRPEHEIDFAAYLLRIDPTDKAGGYSAQEDGGELIASISGCRDNVIGLPVRRLLAELAGFAGR